MIFDPHVSYNPNFKPEWWRYFQVDPRTLRMAEMIQEIVSRGESALYGEVLLNELTFDIVAKSGEAACLLDRWRPWVAATALCMLTHSYYESAGGFITFTLSPSENEPLFGNNVRFLLPRIGRVHGEAVAARKGRKNETKDIGSAWNRQDIYDDEVSEKGTRQWSSSEQNLFPDLY